MPVIRTTSTSPRYWAGNVPVETRVFGLDNIVRGVIFVRVIRAQTFTWPVAAMDCHTRHNLFRSLVAAQVAQKVLNRVQ